MIIYVVCGETEAADGLKKISVNKHETQDQVYTAMVCQLNHSTVYICCSVELTTFRVTKKQRPLVQHSPLALSFLACLIFCVKMMIIIGK